MSQPPTTPVCLPQFLGDDGEGGNGACLFGFFDDDVEVVKNFRDGHGVDFAAGVIAFFDQLAEIAAGGLYRDLVGDDFAGALLLFDPGGAGHGDPHGAVVDIEADVDGVGVAGCDGHHSALPAAVQVFAGPTVGYVEVFVHGSSLPLRVGLGKVGGPGFCLAGLLWARVAALDSRV
jgi:hypothetical protein